MKFNLKTILQVLFYSIVSSMIVLFVCLLDNPAYKIEIASTILLTIWAFFIVPASILIFTYVKNLKDNTLEAFSFKLGFLFGYNLISNIILVILLSPVLGCMFYYYSFKNFKK